MQQIEQFVRANSEIVIALCGATLIVGILLLAARPGQIARKRGHANAEAIRICGWLGLIFWPLLLIAYIWAHTGPDRRRESR